MIKILINKDGTQIKMINVNGHANYDEYGKDIVCASVSSICITSVNAILRLYPDSLNVNEKDGLIIEVISDNNEIQSLLDNMIDLLKELTNDYPKNIIIKEE